MTNIAAIISSHKKQVLKPKIESYGCNCRDRDSCPVENQCLTPQIVYRADVSNNKDNETKFYYGLTETSFQKRYGNHKRSFIHEQHNTKMTLNCRNISGILQVFIKFQPSNGALSEKYTETQNQISVSYV